MNKETSTVNQAIGIFYAAGVVIAAGIFLSIGIFTGRWVTTLFLTLGGGIGFGLLMHAVVTTLAYFKGKNVN